MGGKVDPDDQAFPVPETEWHTSAWGLSVRDYIAIKFASALLSHPGLDMEVAASKFSAHAYALADAMIAERNK